eukprot:1021782-Rhodomonas_salina.2
MRGGVRCSSDGSCSKEEIIASAEIHLEAATTSNIRVHGAHWLPVVRIVPNNSNTVLSTKENHALTAPQAVALVRVRETRRAEAVSLLLQPKSLLFIQFGPADRAAYS